MGAGIEEELGLHVVAVGLGVEGVGCGGGLDGAGAEAGKEGVGDLLGDGGFGGKDVGVVGVEGAGPEGGVGGAVDEANVDDELVEFAGEAAEDERLDAQIAAGGDGIRMLAEDGADGGRGTDGELAGGAEFVGDSVGEAHAEVLVLLLIGGGGEGENGERADGSFCGGACGGGSATMEEMRAEDKERGRCDDCGEE